MGPVHIFFSMRWTFVTCKRGEKENRKNKALHTKVVHVIFPSFSLVNRVAFLPEETERPC